jgi:chain length determinant protein EpsF
MLVQQVPLIPALRARWRAVLVTWLAIVAVVGAVTLALPPRYEATASVVAELSGTDPIGGQAVMRPSTMTSSYIATQADIIQSEQVARSALRSLGLHQSEEWRARWQKATGGERDFEAWVAAGLLRKLAVKPSRDSNVLHLSYTSSDPELSAAVANAFVKAYMDATLQMQVRPAQQFNVFFEERAKPLRQALEEAKNRLSAYEKQHGLLVTDERGDVESARLAELTSQLVTLEDELADAANRRRQAASSPALMRELRRDPEVVALTAELARHEARLSELRSGFGEKHPGVIEARQAVKALEQRIDSSMRRAAQGMEAPVRVNQARLAEVRAAIERQRKVVLERKARRDAAAALVRDVENAQRAYDAVLTRASQTAMEKENTTQTNISILKAATVPPQSPLLILNLAVAAVLGLLLGVARALFAEKRDRRLRTLEDVTERLQQTLLLALPDANAQRGRSARRSEQTRQRLVSTQPLLTGPR